MKTRIPLALALLMAAALHSAAAPAPATRRAATRSTRANPFLEPSGLPFHAPRFDAIRDGDYQPAIEAGMRRQLAEISAIANDPAPPTFANTIVAMERSGALLTRVSSVFFGLVQANANDTLQRIRATEAPRLAAHHDAIYMNAALYARVKSLYERRATLGLDAQAAYLLERYHLNFVRAGAELSAADQATLRSLNQEEASLSTAFNDKLLAESNACAVVVGDRSQLDGLSEGDLAAAAEAARSRGLPGKWVLALQNTTQQPQLASLRDRALRRRLLDASMMRGRRGGPNDTRAIVTRLAQERAQRARLLGFTDYAALTLDDHMARTPDAAMKLLEGIVPAASAKAAQEAARMQKLVDAGHGGFTLGAEDWSFYSEKVRKAEYDFDQSEVRPYLELDRVVREGVFRAATKLYGITFRERKDLPVYHPDVRVWEVLDADGKPLALFYGDYFARPSKSGGAWCDEFVTRNGLRGTRAVVFNVTNFTRPAAGQPALLSFDDVVTLFHEFGHALHGMFNDPRYPLLGDVPPDFVETPSQLNEHWAVDPEIMAGYARHYRTGAAMPQALLDKILATRRFNTGYDNTEYLAACLLDMAWHTVQPQDSLADVEGFEAAALRRFHVDLPQVPPRYRTPYFAHIWEGGYAAGYYAYLWSEVIDDDAYAWFKENGGMTRENGQRFRDRVLARAGTEDSGELYREFRGRDASIEPFLEEQGLEPAPR